MHSTRASLICNHCGSPLGTLLSSQTTHSISTMCLPCRPYRRVVLCCASYLRTFLIGDVRDTLLSPVESSPVQSGTVLCSSVHSKGTLQSPDSIRSDPEIRTTRAVATRELVSHVIRCTQCVRACVSIFLSSAN